MEKWVYVKAEELIEQGSLLNHWRLRYPSCGVLALVAEQDRAYIPELQKLAASEDIMLAGAVFPSLIVDNQFINQGIWLLFFQEMPKYSLLPLLDSENELSTIATQIESLLSNNNQSGLMLFFDAMLPNISSILDAFYLTLGDAVSYSGVNSGSETFQSIPCLFDQGQIIKNGLLALAMPFIAETYIRHDYLLSAGDFIATSINGNCISQINFEPTFDVYKKIIKGHYNQDMTTDNFYELASHFPIGILLENGETLVRIPVQLNIDGSIHCVGEIPENSLLTVLAAIKSEDETTTDGVSKYIQSIDEQCLLFYCAGRRLHLSEGSNMELDRIMQKTNKPIIGAVTLGEIGSSRRSNYPLFHNAALVSLPLSL